MHYTISEEQLRELRNKERLVETRNFLIIASSVLTLPLFFIFWLTDVLNFPEHRWQLLAVRCLTIPVVLTTNWITKRYANTLVRAQWAASYLIFGNCVILDAIIWMTGGGASAHYNGLNLVCVGGLVVFAWTTPFLLFNISLIYGPYLALVALTTHGSAAWGTAALHLFFIGGTIVISLVLRDFAEHLRLRDLKSRLQLREELKSRARIIEEKTNEAVRLRSLTKQFSPQVVHAIQSGRLDILQSIHPSHICAVFIDIVDSTKHVKQIGMQPAQRVVSLFMEDTMKVLLKYDITIDKFLGDGVLGFSNDPIPREDFLQRVVDAALEVRLRVQSHGDEYAEAWSEPLKIRVGIASGEASVGFYGSEEYFKSYTAIGDVMNLACRLCDLAEPNQIIVSPEVATRLSTEIYATRSLGPHVLKGFEAEGTACYEVVSSHRVGSILSAINVCPNGHGVLHLDDGPMGTPVYLCRNCGYAFNPDEPAALEKAG